MNNISYQEIVLEWFSRLPKGYAQIPYSDSEIKELQNVLQENNVQIPEHEILPGNCGIELVTESSNADGVIDKEELIEILNKEDFTPNQLKALLNVISGFRYQDEVLSFLNSKGKPVASVSKMIYNTLIENGDIQAYHKYITTSIISYSGLKPAGNLKEVFKDIISQDTLDFLLDIKPSSGNVATGKGEVLICVMTSDANGDTKRGDIDVGGKGVEVKNRGAAPMGQKAQFGRNSDKLFIGNTINGINDILDSPLKVNTKGKRPLHRLGVIFKAVSEIDEKKVDAAIEIADTELKNAYPGLDFSNFNLKEFQAGDSIDMDKAEDAFVKKVIEYYVELEDFEEVFFLDDRTGKYAIIPSDKLVASVGTKLKVILKDGLPRWSYTF